MSSFNLANWEEHPTDNRYYVFRFNKQHLADRFAQLLHENGLEIKRHEEEGLYLFAVHSNNFDQARKLNYLVMAEQRQPMIGNAYLRWALVLLVLAFVTIALIGHCNGKANSAIGIVEREASVL